MTDALPTTRAFVLDDAVAVRLPSQMGVAPGTVLEIERNGDTVTLRPQKVQTWSEFMTEFSKLPKPSYVEKRVPIEFPDRSGQ